MMGEARRKALMDRVGVRHVSTPLVHIFIMACHILGTLIDFVSNSTILADKDDNARAYNNNCTSDLMGEPSFGPNISYIYIYSYFSCLLTFFICFIH